MSKQIFKFPIPELCQRADKLAISYKRDENEFISYGYNGTTLITIETKTEELKQFPSDDYYGGLQKLTTDQKNESRSHLETNIVDLKTRVKLALGSKSVDYSLFRFNKLGSLNDNELVQYALHVVNTAQPMLEKLAERLVTQEMLDAILADRKKLDDAIDKQSTAISERREKKVKRNELANELYTLLSELSELGKTIWKNKNQAFYTDYVIYGSSKSMEDQLDEQDETSEAE